MVKPPPPDTVATFGSPAAARELADALIASLTDAGHPCGRISEVGDGVAFDARVGRRIALVLVVPAPDGGWTVHVGRTILGTGRLLGMSDAADRRALAAAIDGALRGRDDVSDLRWWTDAAWEAASRR